MTINLSERLSFLGLSGVALAADSITDGELSLAMGEASQLSVTLVDPDGLIVSSGGAALGRSMSWGGLSFTIASVQHGPQSGVRHTTLTGRTAGWQKLKNRKGDKTWRGMSPTGVVKAECSAAGLKVVAQATAAKKSISRLAQGADRKSTSDTELFDRLASEQGFVFGEVAGTFYFGAPSWLVKRAGWAVNGEADYLLEYPTFNVTSDDKDTPARVTLKVAGVDPNQVLLPFSPVQLSNVPKRFAGRYLIDRVSIPFGVAEPASVELVTPVDPEKQT